MEPQAEFRRIHIIYFLRRRGKIDHPHLLRLQISKNGVRLRDVKRWLGELRGEDMPDSYSWSYKRKYKSGYVWQDLMDEDLITPVSDNEYVLEGTEILPADIKDKKKDSEDQKALCKEEGQGQSHSSEASVYMSTKSSEIEEESPPFSSSGSSTVTDDSTKACPKVNSSGGEKHTPPLFSTILSKIKSSNGKTETTLAAPSAREPNLVKSKSCSNGGTWIFRNLVTCRTAKTNEAALVAVNGHRRRLHFLSLCPNDARDVVKSAEAKPGDRLGGAQRAFKIPTWATKINGRNSYNGLMHSAWNQGKLKSQRCGSGAHNFCNWPDCSQCGSTFKPEKMNKHMKACKGMKACTSNAAAMTAAVSTSQKASKGFAESSASAQLLYCSTSTDIFRKQPFT